MEKKSLSQRTAERLYTQIAVERRMAPGEKLPNEVELSQRLGVSRATLREALRALTTQGVLEVRRGAERETLRKIASARVSQAGQLIFERVVLDGHR